MKKEYTRDQIVTLVKTMDKRCASMTDDQIDLITNDAYSEISVYAQPFTDEAVVDMSDYYAAGEKVFTVDIEDDVAYIYDLYGTVETVTPLHKVYNANAIYQDGREVGRVHVDLSQCGTINNVVIKYAYTPEATYDNVFMDKPTYSILIAALRVAIDVALKDEKRESKNRQLLQHKLENLLPVTAHDLGQSFY